MEEIDEAAVIRATTVKWSTTKDGDLNIGLRVERYDAQKAIIMLTTEPGIHVAIARLGEGV